MGDVVEGAQLAPGGIGGLVELRIAELGQILRSHEVVEGVPVVHVAAAGMEEAEVHEAQRGDREQGQDEQAQPARHGPAPGEREEHRGEQHEQEQTREAEELIRAHGAGASLARPARGREESRPPDAYHHRQTPPTARRFTTARRHDKLTAPRGPLHSGHARPFSRDRPTGRGHRRHLHRSRVGGRRHRRGARGQAPHHARRIPPRRWSRACSPPAGGGRGAGETSAASSTAPPW